MSVGIIGYSVISGLGLSVHQLKKHLGIEHQLVIPHGRFTPVADWCTGPGYMLSPSWEPSTDVLTNFVRWNNLSAIVAFETWFGPKTYSTLKSLGVRCILFPMGEWYSPTDPQYQADVFICISDYTYSQIPEHLQRIRLDWAVDTTELPFKERKGPPTRFIHNAGNLGIGGRKGTVEAAIGYAKAVRRGGLRPGATLSIQSQQPLQQPTYVEPSIHYNIGTLPNYADLYEDGDMLLYPAHMDGHALVIEEALACGLPSITTNAAPMNEFHRQLNWTELLVNVAETSPAGTNNPQALRSHVDFNHFADILAHASELDMAPYSRQARQLIEDKYSWEKLKSKYLELLG